MPALLCNKILERLNQFADLQKIEMTKNFCPTSMEIIGVSTPDMRKVFMEFKKEFNTKSTRFLIELTKMLAQTGILECQQFGFEMISKNNKLINAFELSDLEAFKKNLDNWVSVDSFSLFLSGKLWQLKKVDMNWIKTWASSDNFWFRRVAVVSTVPLNLRSKGGKGDTKQTIEVCNFLKSDKSKMVQKGISWALRELSKTDKTAVADFMIRNENFMAGFVKKEVWHKLEYGTKN